MSREQRAAAIMNIGWIFLGCALVILALMAFTPWGKKERVNVQKERMFGANQHFLAGLDDVDARLVRRDEITWLLGAGRKIEAIKLYRADTGVSLAAARAAIERMELALRTDPLLPDEPQTPALPGDLSDSFKREVEALLLRGKKIKAIRYYREQTGLGLREARDAVDLMENELGLPGATASSLQGNARIESGLPYREEPDEAVRRALQEGRKIEAIKRYREQTGLSLLEAKDAVDLMESEFFPLNPEPGSALPTGEEPDEAVRRALQEGRKIEAIKRYREQTGLGLREAKDAVDLMEKELYLPGATPPSFQHDPGIESTSRAREEPDEAVMRALQEGRKIEAIKLYREQTGLGLREAKDAVERLEQMRRQSMEQS